MRDIQRNRQGTLESHFQKEELPQSHSGFKQEGHGDSLTDGSEHGSVAQLSAHRVTHCTRH